MLSQQNRATAQSPTPYLLQALGGIVIGVLAIYCLYYASEILTLSHTLDLQFFGVLLLLGVPVLCIGYYDERRTTG